MRTSPERVVHTTYGDKVDYVTRVSMYMYMYVEKSRDMQSPNAYQHV